MNSPRRSDSSSMYPWSSSYDADDMFGMDFYPSSNNNATELQQQQQEPWPIPDDATMAARLLHRSQMVSESERHLRIHPHNGMSDTGRNIVTVVRDREILGHRGLVRARRLRNSRPMIQTHGADGSPMQLSTGSKPGDRSPSTVLESPPQQQQQQRATVLDPIPSPVTEEADDVFVSSSVSSSTPRRVSYPMGLKREVQTFAEYRTAVECRASFVTHLGGDDELDADGNRPPSSRSVSTISIAFSPDGQSMASTHGDHTVKITCCTTGRLLQSLEGHPRTPWTVKYHPTDARVVASGCLGHQVRVWNWKQKFCLQMIRLEFAIISLSFHPSGTVLAIANGTRLHFWGVDDCLPDSEESSSTPASPRSPSRAKRITEQDQRHMLRCVHFPPSGDTLIIGGANPTAQDERRRRNTNSIGGSHGMSFYLRLWDFDLETALRSNENGNTLDGGSNNVVSPIGLSLGRKAISNSRVFVPRALLYNDGGFDVSPDGKSLCVCAEYWLPHGVDNAMELLHRETRKYEASTMQRRGSVSESSDLSESPNKTNAAARAVLGNAPGDSSSLSYFRELLDQSSIQQSTTSLPRTPSSASPEGRAYSAESTPVAAFVPTTPPVSIQPRMQNLSPPPPPGRRPVAGGGILRPSHETDTIVSGSQPVPGSNNDSTSSSLGSNVTQYSRGSTRNNMSTSAAPASTAAGAGATTATSASIAIRPPHHLCVLSAFQASSPRVNGDIQPQRGRYVPHVVVVSLDQTPIPEECREPVGVRNKALGAVAYGYRPRLGQLMEAYPLDASKASAVTCVKFSPSTDFCLIGYGVRAPVAEAGGFHPVTSVYRIRGGMDHVSTMLSGDDDVNIARFHPDSGHSFIYGTKQGRVRVLGPRPWNFYFGN